MTANDHSHELTIRLTEPQWLALTRHYLMDLPEVIAARLEFVERLGKLVEVFAAESIPSASESHLPGSGGGSSTARKTSRHCSWSNLHPAGPSTRSARKNSPGIPRCGDLAPGSCPGGRWVPRLVPRQGLLAHRAQSRAVPRSRPAGQGDRDRNGAENRQAHQRGTAGRGRLCGSVARADHPAGRRAGTDPGVEHLGVDLLYPRKQWRARFIDELGAGSGAVGQRSSTSRRCGR